MLRMMLKWEKASGGWGRGPRPLEFNGVWGPRPQPPEASVFFPSIAAFHPGFER
jgi:hypothetical protein